MYTKPSTYLEKEAIKKQSSYTQQMYNTEPNALCCKSYFCLTNTKPLKCQEYVLRVHFLG